MALTKNQVENITSHYAGEYDLWENLHDREECVEQHGNNRFYIYVEKSVKLKTDLF